MPIPNAVFQEEIELAERFRSRLKQFDRACDTLNASERKRLIEELVADFVLFTRAHAVKISSEPCASPPR